MNHGVPPHAAREAWRAQRWRILRLAVEYMLDLVAIERDGGSVLDPLVIAVVSAASVSAVSQDVGLDRAFATLDAPPPDEVRRPIAINAVAATLRLPFESVRRCVHRLVRQGELELKEGGVVQPARVAHSDVHVCRSLAHFGRTRELYGALRENGFAPLGDAPASAPFDAAPVRLVNRLRGEFALRAMLAAMSLTGNPLTSLVLFDVAVFNLAAVANTGDLRIPPATRLRPVWLAEVSRRLNLSKETVRRHLAKLVESGFLQRGGHGFALRQDGFAGVRAQAALEMMETDFRRYVERLEQLGVVGWWDRDAASPGGALQI